MKKTKIVATMSDFRCTEEFVKNLFDAGMDVVRVNSAHVSEEGATHIVETVHRVNPAIPIMIDTKGPEIRVTTIADEYGNSINFRPGDRVAVRGSDGSDKTTRKVVYMNVPNIVDDIPVGARMLIADGELEIRVVEKTAEELICEFVVGGAMRSRKSVNVPSVSIPTAARSRSSRRSRTARGSTTSTRSSKRRTASWWRAATWAWSFPPRRFPIPSGVSSRSASAPSVR